MKELHTNTVALIVGVFAGLFHLMWALLVSFGVAQGILDWIYSIHFLNNPFQVAAFSISTTVTLVVFTFVAGYVFGWVFAVIWNMLHKK